MAVIIDDVFVDAIRSSPKEEFVIEYLDEIGEDFVMNLYRAWKNYAVERGLKVGSLGSFRVKLFDMKKRNIIRQVREERTIYGIPRHYYRLVR